MTLYTEFPGDEITAVHWKKEPKPPDPEPEPGPEPEECGVTERPIASFLSGTADWHWNFLGNFHLSRVYFADPALVPEEDRFDDLPGFWFLPGAVRYTIEWVVDIVETHTKPDGAPIYTVTIPYQTGLNLSPATKPGPVGTPGERPTGSPLESGPPIDYELDVRDFDGVGQSVWFGALYGVTGININTTPAPPNGWDANREYGTGYLRITAYCLEDETHKDRGPVRKYVGPLLPMRMTRSW